MRRGGDRGRRRALACSAVAPAAQRRVRAARRRSTPAEHQRRAPTATSRSRSTITEPAHDLKDLTIHLPPGLVGNPLATPACTEEQLNANALPGRERRRRRRQRRHPDRPRLPPGRPDGQRQPLQRRPPRRRAGAVRDRPQRAAVPSRSWPRRPAADHPAVGGVAAPERLRPRHHRSPTCRTRRPSRVWTTEIDINALSLDPLRAGRHPAAGLHPQPDLVQDPHGRLRRDRLRRPDGERTGDASTPSTAGAAVHARVQRQRSSASARSTQPRRGLDRRSRRRSTRPGCSARQVILPDGLVGNTTRSPSSARGRASQAGTCPANTIVGTAVAASPLQSQPLTGPVALVRAGEPGLPDSGSTCAAPLALKLRATIALTAMAATVVTFDGLPDIPISDFTLTFAGGPNGLNRRHARHLRAAAAVFDARSTPTRARPRRRPRPRPSTAPARRRRRRRRRSGKKPKAKIKLGKPGQRRADAEAEVKAGAEKLRRRS